MSVGFYIVNYKDDERRSKMINRVKSIGMDAIFVNPVSVEDPRICNQPIDEFEKRNWSIFFQHVDSMTHFVENTTFDYCIIAEDDVHLSKDLKNELINDIIPLYNRNEIDILLLSYLWPFDVAEDHYFPVIERTSNFKLQGYPMDLWGAHLYMMNRQHAKTLIDLYTPEFAIAQTPEKPFCSDWQITKFGKKALIAPMVGVEEGDVKTDHPDQQSFHRRSFEHNFVADKFV